MTSTHGFTVDDLTVAEHGILSRHIKGRPEYALATPDARNFALALAGLAWLRDKRSDPSVKLDDYQGRTIGELNVTLGLAEPDRTTHRLHAALRWVEVVTELEHDEDAEPGQVEDELETGPAGWLSSVDPDTEPQTTLLGRALVYAMAGVDPGADPEEAAQRPEPAATTTDLAQDAIDDVAEEDGQDPTARPASPSSDR